MILELVEHHLRRAWRYSLWSMDRAKRIVVVTFGLSVTGSVVGALCANAAVAILVSIRGGLRALPSHELARLFEIASGFGAAAGFVGAPLLGWGLLRSVPLRRAIAVTALGCVAGAVLGEVARPVKLYTTEIPAALLGAFLGFLLAGILLSLHSRVADGAVSTEPYNEGGA